MSGYPAILLVLRYKLKKNHNGNLIKDVLKETDAFEMHLNKKTLK
jgi:hypothetical protein